MKTDKKILGIITARGGSKGIPRKNVVPLCGKPLLLYMIEASLQSTLLTRCIVSTDDNEIAQIARDAGADVPFMRPGELAQDDTRDLPVLQHAIQWVQEHDGETYDAIMMLHPTSPLCLGKDIDACIERMVETDADSVMSMVEVTDFALHKLKKIENGQILPLLEEEGKEAIPRKEGTMVYKRNAAMYLTKTELILQNDMFGKRCMAYIMPQERSVDINTPFDVKVAELLLKQQSPV